MTFPQTSTMARCRQRSKVVQIWAAERLLTDTTLTGCSVPGVDRRSACWSFSPVIVIWMRRPVCHRCSARMGPTRMSFMRRSHLYLSRWRASAACQLTMGLRWPEVPAGGEPLRRGAPIRAAHTTSDLHPDAQRRRPPLGPRSPLPTMPVPAGSAPASRRTPLG